MNFPVPKTATEFTRSKGRPQFLVAIVLILVVGGGCSSGDAANEEHWRKGNLHTHSLWSDGDQFPEVIGQWYVDRGYDFLAISDHNTIADGEKWVDISPSTRGARAMRALTERFGVDYVATRDSLSKQWARLSTFDEYQPRIERPGEFILIRAQEITDAFGSLPVHINASNIRELIRPQHGASVRETMQRNLDEVARQREETGAIIVPHINHPNFVWGITADDLAFITGDKFFEVYNGHPSVNNDGDSTRMSTEEIWDYVLASRLSRGMEPMYGIGTDDAHSYHDIGLKYANPGRGWVMVNEETLRADSLLTALEAGRFYASSGVDVRNIRFDGTAYSFSIVGVDGESYRTRFIASVQGAVPAEGDQSLPEGVGIVVGEDSSLNPSYVLRGNEAYVRAVVTSTKLKENPYSEGEFERAWLQPVVPILE